MTLGGGLASVAVEVRADALDVVDWLVLFVAAPPMLDDTLEVALGGGEAESDDPLEQAVRAIMGRASMARRFVMTPP